MTLKTSKRGAIPPFIVMDVMRAAAAREATGKDTLHLEVGQPSTSAPEKVLKAAEEALRNDKLGYTLALGVPALREQIATHYSLSYGVTINPERIVATMGSSCGFLLAFLSAFDVGDRVGVCSPGYPAYRNILRAVGIEAVDIPVGPETGFNPTPELIDSLGGDLDGLLLASPSNPTGSMLSEVELKRLVEYCSEQEIRFISDEIYHGITYGKQAHTALEFGNDSIIINSFSKYFSMTGWRLGWMVIPEELSRSVECLAQNMFISPPTLSQLAAVAAFDCRDELDLNVIRYAKSRERGLGDVFLGNDGDGTIKIRKGRA